MNQKSKTLSQVVPILVAALVCDTACTDPSSGKHTLVGIFDIITAPKFPMRRPFSLYLKIADAEGYYKFEVIFVQVSTGKRLAGAEGEIQADDRAKAIDLRIGFPPLPIPSEGRYEFQVWANSMYLGSTCIDTVKQNLP